jgi:phage tail-like protein
MAERNDPYRNCRYLLEIDGITQAGFSEVSLPDSTQDPIDVRVGSEPPSTREIPGLIKYGNLTLKWGITNLGTVRKNVEV